MRQLFVIQCHKFEPALKLGRLIISMSSDFDVFYAYDLLSPEAYRFKALGENISHGFNIGYFTLDQALFHVNLWSYLAESGKFNHVEYFHLISQNDLPGIKSLEFDKFIKDYDCYALIQNNGFNNNYKAIAWYGLNYKVCECIRFYKLDIVLSFMAKFYFSYVRYGQSSGGIDEYFIAHLFRFIESLSDIKRLNSTCRLLFWVGENGCISDDNVTPISVYGKSPEDSKVSPITLLDTPEVIRCLTEVDYIVSARKFEFNSDVYNRIYNLILNG